MLNKSNVMKINNFSKRYKSFMKAMESSKPKPRQILKENKKSSISKLSTINTNSYGNTDMIEVIESLNNQLKSITKVITDICSSNNESVSSQKRIK